MHRINPDTKVKAKLLFDVILLIIDVAIGCNASSQNSIVAAIATGVLLGICFLLDLDALDLPLDDDE